MAKYETLNTKIAACFIKKKIVSNFFGEMVIWWFDGPKRFPESNLFIFGQLCEVLISEFDSIIELIEHEEQKGIKYFIWKKDFLELAIIEWIKPNSSLYHFH